MVGSRLVGLVLAVSFLNSQDTAAEPEVNYIPNESVCCNENSCKRSFDKNYGAMEPFLTSLHSSIHKAELELANPNDYPPHYNVGHEEQFDFIVVGAGSAGSVVASRLSEVGDWRVLLVEAGGDPPVTSEIPSLAAFLHDTEVDWQYKTDADEENCLGMVGNQCKWPRGKVLGGSSTINYMMHTRGHPKDFDSWAAAGNKGWSYEEVLPYFKKSENLDDPLIWATEDAKIFHNSDGLLTVGSWAENEMKEAIEVVAEGLADIGYPFNADLNGKNHSGFTKMSGAIRDQRRCSSAKSFLTPAKNRRNLFLSKNSLVTKILMDIQHNKVYGIHLMNKEGKIIEVKVKKEIIVSAGAINSPQLLMLSGIGPERHLQELGIPVIKNLPVGENLQDHSLMATIALTLNLSITFSPFNDQDTFNFLFKKPGSLSSAGLPYAAFINIDADDYPNMELLQSYNPKNNTNSVKLMLQKSFNFKDELLADFININKMDYTIILLASMLRPYSRGRILLKSDQPNTYPQIIAGTFTDQRDVETYLKVYDFISRLVDTQAMRNVGAKFHEIKVPGCSQHEFASRAYRECAMRHLTGTTYHYSGTCKMGPARDSSAVVDPTLRVHGVEGLRVADASVMPTVVSGHPNAAIVMIGEKVADLIKGDWS
ncbi:glucose dehydrogenase [FAD, quinone]-like [Macrosteles quadrilineatus]|uniref:glucose dehydrogenase [FAD, quinone]-like n=1 Tax=Macrosteles quadrilineatus TaxID=74068 RepID=UPI0023E2AC3C|nr:glucose dehydrogenase [FAD, quinone]-like [Macrosteles quadrilineatus]